MRFTQNDSNVNTIDQEVARLRRENARLKKLLGLKDPAPQLRDEPRAAQQFLAEPLPTVTARSSVQEKIALFRTLFRGREDVYAIRWVNEWSGKAGYAPACAEPWASTRGKPKRYLPLTDEVLRDHLDGTKTVGLFPLLPDHTCWFLACDFDGAAWSLDAVAFLKACQRYGIPAYLERSRSGQGGHVWIFFVAPMSAVTARQIGMRLLRETMTERGEMDLASYDRLFPNQDFMPKGGFGNLIALPLQKRCRALGNTEFLNPEDPELRPWPDQWAFLSQVQRLSPAQVESSLEIIPPVTAGPGTGSRASAAVRHATPAPTEIRGVIGAMLSVEKSGVPPWLLAQLKHLASLHNPQFYERQRLRLSTFRTPRFIKCYEEDATHVHLPRGVREELETLCQDAGSRLTLIDERPKPPRKMFKFAGQLTPAQQAAMRSLLRHDLGVLVAPPGAGKTVMGCFAIARRKTPTLVLAHRKPILEQWRAQLMKTLGLPSAKIGQVGGGRQRQTGVVDLGMIQSLKGLDDPESFFSRYGFLIVDECHHIPAFTFEACVKRAPVRYLLGLTATPYRRDGLQEIITMQCGPVRSSMQTDDSDLDRRLMIRETPFTLPADADGSIQEVFRQLVQDPARNALIQEDVRGALAQGRRCLVLSQWREHCRLLAEGLRGNDTSPFILNGTLGKKERSAVLRGIEAWPPEQGLLLIATGQFLGEGFDCPQIDTLVLAFPISFKGKLVQYVGRILRDHPGKAQVTVYEYADLHVPVLKAMHLRRRKTYKSLGFHEEAGALF